jgi:hypothetical protein
MSMNKRRFGEIAPLFFVPGNMELMPGGSWWVSLDDCAGMGEIQGFLGFALYDGRGGTMTGG